MDREPLDGAIVAPAPARGEQRENTGEQARPAKMKLFDAATRLYRTGKYTWPEVRGMMNRITEHRLMPSSRRSELRRLEAIHEAFAEAGIDLAGVDLENGYTRAPGRSYF